MSLLLLALVLSLSLSLCTDQKEFLEKCNRTNVSGNVFLFPGQMTPFPGIKPCDQNETIKVSFINQTTAFALRHNPTGVASIAVYHEQASSRLMCVKTSGKVSKVRVTLLYCPPGFLYINGTCWCVPQSSNPNVVCVMAKGFSGVVVGHCVSRKSGKEPLLVARCGFASHAIQPLLSIGQNNTTGETNFCQKFNRRGKLCSECTNGNGLSVFSDTFDCISCSGFKAKNLVIYLSIELIPTTIFVLVILFFHIGITTGPVNGYIFFAQMVTTRLEVLFLTFGWKLYAEGNTYLAKIMPQWIINPYCIWNLNFYRIFNEDICLHPSLKAVHVLALRLVLALYPLLLVLVTYVIIELKARNIRVVTCLWRLVCFNCVRWRRVWQAKTSVIDAFASCVLLSYTKVVLVSMFYLSPSDVNDDRGMFIGKVLSVDTSMTFLSRAHTPYVVVAVVMLLTFGTLPPLILTFYQFHMFQSCLQCVRLRGVGIQRFVEAYQGCYRDGTDGKIDCRFFAGLYFLLRCIVLIILAGSPSYPTCFTAMIIVLAVFLLLLATFRPYKKQRYNIIDSAIICLFITITAIQMYIYYTLHQTLKISRLFTFYHFLLAVPLAYITVYVANWLYRQWKQRHNRRSNTPGDRMQPDFFRESALEERALLTDRESPPEERAPVRGETVSSDSTRQPVSQTEVSIHSLSDAEGNEGKIGGQDCGGGRFGDADKYDGSDEELARERPRSLTLVHHELEAVAHYGRVQ